MKGKATHPDGVAVLTIGNDVIVPAADGSFTHVVNLKEGVNEIVVTAVSKKAKTSNLAIGVHAGAFLAPGKVVTDAAAARVSNEALRTASTVAGAALASNLKALSGKRLGQWAVAPLGHRIVTTVEVGAVKVTNAKVGLEGRAAGLHAEVGLTNLDVTLEVEVDAGSFLGKKLRIQEKLPVHFDKLAAEGLVDAAVRNGVVVVDAKNLNLDYAPTLTAKLIGQSNIDRINKALGGISGILPGSPKLQIDEVAIVNKLIDLAWAHGLKKTADTHLASLINSKATGGLPVTVGTVSANVRYVPRAFDVDAGGFSLVTDLDVALGGADKHASKGSFVTTGASPRLAGATGVQLAVAQDAVNRVLEAAWRKGMLDRQIDVNLAKKVNQFTAKDLALFIPALKSAIPAGAELEFAIRPRAAPLVQLAKGTKATLSLTELELELGIETPAKKHVTLLVLNVDVEAPVGFKLAGSGANQAISLDVGRPKFHFDVVKSIAPGIDELPVETTLEFLLPGVVQFAASKLVGPIPLPQTPALAGLKPRLTGLATDGTKFNYLRVNLALK